MQPVLPDPLAQQGRLVQREPLELQEPPAAQARLALLGQRGRLEQPDRQDQRELLEQLVQQGQQEAPDPQEAQENWSHRRNGCDWFHRSNWGNGYATESASRVVEYAMGDLDLDHVVATIVPDNERSSA